MTTDYSFANYSRTTPTGLRDERDDPMWPDAISAVVFSLAFTYCAVCCVLWVATRPLRLAYIRVRYGV